MTIDITMVKKQIGISYLDEFKSILGVLIASVLMAVAVYISSTFFSSNLVKLLVGFLAGVSVYGLVSYFFDICNFKNEYSKVVSKFSRR